MYPATYDMLNNLLRSNESLSKANLWRRALMAEKALDIDWQDSWRIKIQGFNIMWKEAKTYAEVYKWSEIATPTEVSLSVGWKPVIQRWLSYIFWTFV